MTDFRFCAVCLVAGVKMHSCDYRISSDNIMKAFSKIVYIPEGICNINFCFECASLLAKYEEFRLKCCRAQSILSAIKTEDDKKIYNYIQSIDREQNRLTSNLTASQTIQYDNQTQITKDFEVQIKTDAVKLEKTDNIELNDFNFEDTVDHEAYTKTQIGNRKRNKVVKYRGKLVNKSNDRTEQESVSDDEPLAKKVTRHTERIKVNNKDNIEDASSDTKEMSTFCTKQEWKLGKKYKDCGDFEDYASVVFLTPEEARKEVLLRKESSNYINSPLKCGMCYRGYEAKVAFENHMKKHSIEYGEFQCNICQLRFPQQRYLCKHHLASHRRKFCCKICPYVCFCMHQAKTHVSLHKGKKYPCKECREVFSMPNSLLMHRRQKHAAECVCELCGHTFATPRGLHSHRMKIHRQHTNEMLGPKCEECNKHFATREAWRIHLVLSSKHSVSNGCKYCGETFESSQELKCHIRKHARQHLRPDGGNPGACPMCDKFLETRAEYRAHVSSVHPDSEVARKLNEITPFVCEVCGKMFKKQCFLIYHQRKHSGERPYECAECHKTFHLASALTTHRAVHLEKRAHKCGICARVFTFKSVLNKHMKVHLGIRPHRCDICDKSFISPCDVKVHIKYVHNKVPWPKRDKSKHTDSNYTQKF